VPHQRVYDAAMADDLRAFSDLADRIEAELRGLGAWESTRPPPDVLATAGPFGMNSLAYIQWIQWVLVPRLREVAEGAFAVPVSSDAGAHAVREFDGWHGAAGLTHLLIELDDLVAGWPR
jgi:uncharacterized protein YqcC (DUF446 family)